MAQIEALCCNIPVIASNIPGFRESLSNHGVFVNRNNIDDWVYAIKNSDELFKDKKPIDRAKELDPIKDLAKFEKWLIKISKLAMK